MTLDVAAVLRGTKARALRVLPDGHTAAADYSPGDLQREIREIQVDSRAVGAGDMFVALKGEHVDGHDFVREALHRGARCALVQQIPPNQSLEGVYAEPGQARIDPKSLLVVPSTLRSLQLLARSWRMSQPAEVIGITGSIGKT